MKTKAPYNFTHQHALAAIFNYAESLFYRAHLAREYFEKTRAQAFAALKAENLTWEPLSRPYHGKSPKRKGMVYLAVRIIETRQEYGFLFHASPINADMLTVLNTLHQDFCRIDTPVSSV